METFQRILDRFGLVHLRAAQERGGGDLAAFIWRLFQICMEVATLVPCLALPEPRPRSISDPVVVR
jgi:hypothetical protein